MAVDVAGEKYLTARLPISNQSLDLAHLDLKYESRYTNESSKSHTSPIVPVQERYLLFDNPSE